MEEEKKVRTCFHCGVEGSIGKCAGCGVARYCSEECRDSDWNEHKMSCHGQRYLRKLQQAEKKIVLYEDAFKILAADHDDTLKQLDETLKTQEAFECLLMDLTDRLRKAKQSHILSSFAGEHMDLLQSLLKKYKEESK